MYYKYFDYLNIVYRTFYPIKHHLSVKTATTPSSAITPFPPLYN